MSTYGELVSSENRSKKASFLELRSHRSWHSFRLLPNCSAPQDTKLRIPSVQGTEASTRSPRWKRDIYCNFKLLFRLSNMYSFNFPVAPVQISRPNPPTKDSIIWKQAEYCPGKEITIEHHLSLSLCRNDFFNNDFSETFWNKNLTSENLVAPRF